jgi:hypothetical protein
MAAFLMMVSSASLTHTGLDQSGLDAPAVGQALLQGRSLAADALELSRPPEQAFATSLAGTPSDDQPAPALLVYLGLVLVGSAVAVVLVRRSQSSQL